MPLHPVNQLSFPTDFRNKLWVGLGLGVGIGLSLYFWTVKNYVDPGTYLTWQNHGDPI